MLPKETIPCQHKKLDPPTFLSLLEPQTPLTDQL